MEIQLLRKRRRNSSRKHCCGKFMISCRGAGRNFAPQHFKGRFKCRLKIIIHTFNPSLCPLLRIRTSQLPFNSTTVYFNSVMVQEILSGNRKTLIIKSDFSAARIVDFAYCNTGAYTNFERSQVRCKFLKKLIRVRNFLAEVIATLVQWKLTKVLIYSFFRAVFTVNTVFSPHLHVTLVLAF